eukprot:Skav219973  [mRNA]  locus=scaffold2879:449829:450326:+ [translate_table: standard]
MASKSEIRPGAAYQKHQEERERRRRRMVEIEEAHKEYIWKVARALHCTEAAHVGGSVLFVFCRSIARIWFPGAVLGGCTFLQAFVRSLLRRGLRLGVGFCDVL